MTFIQRNANLVLFFLVVLAAASLAGLTVYFERGFEEINRAHAAKSADLDRVSKQLAEKQRALSSIEQELGLKSAREDEITEQFTEIRGEKTVLERTKTQLEKERADLETRVKTLSADLTQTKYELTGKEKEIKALDEDMERLKEQIEDVQSDLKAIKTQRDCLKAKNDSEESGC